MSSCGGGGGGGGECGSQCQSEEETAVEDLGDIFGKLSSAVGGGGRGALCSKCGEAEKAFNGLCATCFRFSLFGKFKLIVTSNAMISPTDKVLVAFSGGPCSRVALQFIHEMQLKALKNWDDSKSQSLPVFGVGVAFIDESIFSVNLANEADKAVEDIRLTVSDLVPAHKELHVTPIESICSQDLMDGKSRLKELLDTIADDTGREDFLQCLRMLCLQKIALDNRYTKLMLGSCTSSIARHILSATVKGQGYSLPADLQYVDSRWEVPVVFPLRDCLAEELNMLCHLDGLRTQQLFDKPSTGINGLVSAFVTRLQNENRSRERTIVRTAEKLKPFGFNKFIENGYHEFVPSRIRRKFQNVKYGEPNLSEVLCPICGSPLSEPEIQSLKSINGKSQTSIEKFVAYCCESCNFQILPKETSSLQHFFSLLPESLTERAKGRICADGMLREQVKDFLLSNGDDEGT